MNTKILAGVVSLGVAFAAVPALAVPGSVSLPDSAREIAPNVFYFGAAHDPGSGKLVEGVMFVRTRGEFAKPPWAGGGKDRNGGSSCYGFLAKGAKWRTVEPWLVNPTNASGLSGSFVFGNVGADIDKWEDAADGVLDGSVIDILGGGSSTDAALVADTSSPDNQNEVYFADVEYDGAIAVTIVWGIFRGPPSGRELVEWDQVYDDVDYAWSSSGSAGAMDFENIATHELGHSVGLADLYESGCSEETMYGYASYGETKKRSLEAGDIAGVSELY